MTPKAMRIGAIIMVSLSALIHYAKDGSLRGVVLVAVLIAGYGFSALFMRQWRRQHGLPIGDPVRRLRMGRHSWPILGIVIAIAIAPPIVLAVMHQAPAGRIAALAIVMGAISSAIMFAFLRRGI